MNTKLYNNQSKQRVIKRLKKCTYHVLLVAKADGRMKEKGASVYKCCAMQVEEDEEEFKAAKVSACEWGFLLK